MDRTFKIATILWSALALNAFGGWQGTNVWPASNQVTFAHVNGHTKSYWWSTDLYNAARERASLASLDVDAVPEPSPWCFERQNLVALKAHVLSISQHFLDKKHAVGGKYDAWFNAQGYYGDQETFPTWDALGTNIAIYCGLPTNYFQETPWRKLEYSPYGWDGLRRIITNLNWRVETGQWGTGTYSEVIGSMSTSEDPTNLTCANLINIAQDRIDNSDYTQCSESEGVVPSRGFIYGVTFQGYGYALSVASSDATPMFDFVSPVGNCLPEFDLYLGSAQNGFGGSMWNDPLYDCGVEYLDSLFYTHYKETKTMQPDVWTYAFTRVGDCNNFDLSIVNCSCGNTGFTYNGGWSAFGPFFVIKYESGLEYQ